MKPKPGLDINGVINLLRKRCEEAGTQKAFAQTNGVSAQYVTGVLNERREPGAAILEALGLEKVVTYKERQ